MSQCAPLCPHFGECGGCLYQDKSYPEEQIGLKLNALQQLFNREVPITPSPEAYGYRNRMDFVCAFGKIGFRKRGTHNQVVEVEQCYLLPKRVAHLFQILKETVREYGIPDFNYLNHQGYLRYITLRVACYSEDVMVSFVTANDDPLLMPLVEAAKPYATSINWIVQSGLADVNYGPVKTHFGQPYFVEKAGDKTYHAGPNTFAQNNAMLTRPLFDQIRDKVSGRTLDLYCGMGAISLYVAERASEVLGVELEGEAIRFAAENQTLNRVQNIRFLAHDVRKWLIENEKKEWFETIILDPPRSGMSQKLCRKVLRMAPTRIIYVSCNPKMLAEDMKAFEPAFTLDSLVAFDMFPQTPHVETVAVFSKKM
ncbi:MAG: 23S rRNA (uracil-5-)-methyltransferase RumA [Elusimicrobia bacterium RIFOXYB2_FULL_49_7]|nr:MAG: 23S rRNA (uracil-5-)-methyltransferase RumA [Elusimicrobia bacterium RIFOXYB2_FULL_49_7]